MLTVIIPNPYGLEFRHEIHGGDVKELASNTREMILREGYGASEIGSQFNVYKDGKQIGLLRYNGSFTEEF